MQANDNTFLRNVWYYALPSHRLKPGQMMARTYLGQPVLLARTCSGKVFALHDICPHRAIPLSCGWFDGQEVQCCYQGWRFNSTGRCTEIPSLMADQEMELSRFDVPHYPVQEIQGNIWVYIPESDTSQAKPPQFDIPRIPGFADQPPNLVETIRFPCFIDYAVVGLMGPAHSPYVHRAWWWRSGDLHDEIKWFDPSAYGFTMRRHKMADMGRIYWLLGGAPEAEIRFHLPSIRIEENATARHRVCNLTAVTPISETETDVTFAFYWTLPWGWMLKPIMRYLVRAFLGQDREVVGQQQIGLKHNPILRFIKDSDTPARWYYQLKREYAQAMAEEREFVNPVKSELLRWRA